MPRVLRKAIPDVCNRTGLPAHESLEGRGYIARDVVYLIMHTGKTTGVDQPVRPWSLKQQRLRLRYAINNIGCVLDRKSYRLHHGRTIDIINDMT